MPMEVVNAASAHRIYEAAAFGFSSLSSGAVSGNAAVSSQSTADVPGLLKVR